MATPTWNLPVEDNWLVVRHGFQVIAETSAGLVAVAKPDTRDGVDVFSVIAAPAIPAEDVWVAVAEVVEQYDDGVLTHLSHPTELVDGHAWTVRRERRTYLEWQAPEPNAVVFTSRLHRWRADADLDLASAPGVAQVALSIAARVPGTDRFGCVQAATAECDEYGFRAAALTAMDWLAGSATSTYAERKVRHVEVTFDRPFAVIAIARGGEWDGVPLFESWVTETSPARESSWRLPVAE